MENPTGISTYALNLIPQLRSLDPILLTPQPRLGFRHHPIPPGLTPEQGLPGHLKRPPLDTIPSPTTLSRLRRRSSLFPPSRSPSRLDWTLRGHRL